MIAHLRMAAMQVTTMMCRSKIIVIDLCDTLAQVTKAIEGIYGPMPDPLKLFHPAVSHPEFWADSGNWIAHEIFKFAEPMPGAVEKVNWLAQKGQIVYLTSRPEWSKSISEKYLKQTGFPNAPVVCTPDKYSWVLKQGASVAFEDLPYHIKKLQLLVPVFVPSQTWNKGLGIQFNWKKEA